MEVRTANVGWCVGIERAYNLMNRQASLANGKPIYATHDVQQPNPNLDMDTLGRIEQGDARLLERYPALKAVKVLQDPSVLRADDTLLLGFHGLPHDTIEGLTGKGIEVKDYKCPFIATLDHTVDRMVAGGCDILIVGKRQNHHSRYAQEAASRHQRRCIVIETLEDVETIPRDTASPWALVGQVTANTRLWQAVVERVHQRGIAVHTAETICPDTYQRQEGAMALARWADCCLVVDDGGGASQSLFEVLSAVHQKVYRCRWRDDGSWKASLDATWVRGAGRVAVVGGILVPKWAIDEVAAYVQGLT